MSAGSWLDDLSPDRATREARQSVVGDWIALNGGRLLMAAFFFVIFIGLHPLQREYVGGAGGSAERQVMYLALAGLALPLILMRWDRAISIVVRSWPLLIVLALMAASALWSNFPGVTIRRFVIVLIMYILAVGLSSALRTPKDFLTALAAGYAVILLIDLMLAAVMPGFAFDALGLAGLHPQKNVAGMAGLMFTACFTAILFGVRQPVGFWVTVLLLLLSFVFLALTKSKTSLGIALLGTVVLAPALALAHRGFVFALLLGAGIVGVVGTIVFMTGAMNLSAADWAELATGDPTFTARDQIWGASLQVIEQKLWLGHGFGGVWSMLPIYHPLADYTGFWMDSEATLLAINQSHNGYLDILMHGGIVLFVAVWLLILKVARDIALSFRWRDRWTIAANVFVGTFLFNTLINNMMESTLFFPDGLLGQFFILFVVVQGGWRLHVDQAFYLR